MVSSFSVETVRLWEWGERRFTALSAGNLLCSLSAIGLAWLVVSILL